eukprot:Pgem_evm1s17411
MMLSMAFALSLMTSAAYSAAPQYTLQNVNVQNSVTTGAMGKRGLTCYNNVVTVTWNGLLGNADTVNVFMKNTANPTLPPISIGTAQVASGYFQTELQSNVISAGDYTAYIQGVHEQGLSYDSVTVQGPLCQLQADRRRATPQYTIQDVSVTNAASAQSSGRGRTCYDNNVVVTWAGLLGNADIVTVYLKSASNPTLPPTAIGQAQVANGRFETQIVDSSFKTGEYTAYIQGSHEQGVSADSAEIQAPICQPQAESDRRRAAQYTIQNVKVQNMALQGSTQCGVTCYNNMVTVTWNGLLGNGDIVTVFMKSTANPTLPPISVGTAQVATGVFQTQLDNSEFSNGQYTAYIQGANEQGISSNSVLIQGPLCLLQGNSNSRKRRATPQYTIQDVSVSNAASAQSSGRGRTCYDNNVVVTWAGLLGNADIVTVYLKSASNPTLPPTAIGQAQVANGRFETQIVDSTFKTGEYTAYIQGTHEQGVSADSVEIQAPICQPQADRRRAAAPQYTIQNVNIQNTAVNGNSCGVSCYNNRVTVTWNGLLGNTDLVTIFMKSTANPTLPPITIGSAQVANGYFQTQLVSSQFKAGTYTAYIQGTHEQGISSSVAKVEGPLCS